MLNCNSEAAKAHAKWKANNGWAPNNKLLQLNLIQKNDKGNLMLQQQIINIEETNKQRSQRIGEHNGRDVKEQWKRSLENSAESQRRTQLKDKEQEEYQKFIMTEPS